MTQVINYSCRGLTTVNIIKTKFKVIVVNTVRRKKSDMRAVKTPLESTYRMLLEVMVVDLALPARK